MMIKNQVITVAGDKWQIREAMSYYAAMDAITHARATGSIGGRDTITSNNITRIRADVVRLNSDGTERQPYQEAY